MKASLRRLMAIAWKEVIHIRRDFRTLYLAFGLPVMMILLFGYAVDFDIDRIRTGVIDRDQSSMSRRFVQRLTAGGWFRVVLYEHSDRVLMEAMDEGRIKVAIIIPAGFERSIKRGEQATLQTLLDGSDNNAASVGQNYLLLFTGQFNASLFESYLARTGLNARGRPHRGLDVSPFIYFNPELKSRFYVLPGIIALTTAILAALLTSLVIAREWERGTMEQLIATPVRSYEIVLGKILPFVGIGIVQTLMTAAFAVYVFGIPFRGNLFWLLTAAFLFSVGTLGLGLMLSSVLKSQLPAMQAAFVATMLPGIILSNFVFPIEAMPPVVRLITYIVPARYFLVVLRTIFLKGSGASAFAMELVFLAMYAGLVLTVATRRLRKKVV